MNNQAAANNSELVPLLIHLSLEWMGHGRPGKGGPQTPSRRLQRRRPGAERKSGFCIAQNVETLLRKLPGSQEPMQHNSLPAPSRPAARRRCRRCLASPALRWLFRRPGTEIPASPPKSAPRASKPGAALTLLPDAQEQPPAPTGPFRPRGSDTT